ncbi:TPA: hypothetical protein NGT82_004635 [Vibrio parahaemolyticus]|nr:hypothetical protein [Vibrio parahaemolyticus]HCE4642747.1 hypothetical protein [Vibrio parahaemolyticus]HCK0628992.1 hypothetical protein [Vibrio parahaemolyticus]
MKILFWLGVLFTLCAPIVIGIHFNDTSTSWVAALSGAFVTFVAKLPEIAELSLGPVKARMRDKIEEASVTITQLKKIAVSNSEATLSDLIAGSFMGGMSQAKRLEIHSNVMNALKEIGADKAELEFVERDWKKGISIIYLRAIKSAVEGREKAHQINSAATDAQKSASAELDILSDFDTWTSPTACQTRKVIEKYGINSEEVEYWIAEYKYFEDHGYIRDKERFAQV